MLDKFAERLDRSRIHRLRDSEAIIEELEDILRGIEQRYRERLGRNYVLDAVVTGLDRFDRGEPYLRHVFDDGTSENVRAFEIIGHGREYASTLFKLLYRSDLTATELGVLGWFTISTVCALDLDQTVGVPETGPEVVILRNNEQVTWFNSARHDFRAAKDSLRGLGYKTKLLDSIWNRTPEAYRTP